MRTTSSSLKRVIATVITSECRQSSGLMPGLFMLSEKYDDKEIDVCYTIKGKRDW